MRSVRAAIATSIEQGGIVDYFSPYTALFGIVGGHGKKEFKGNGFTISNNNGEGQITINDFKILSSNGDRLIISPEVNINPQNVYKGLCKFFLSLVDTEKLTHFKDTIRWVRGNWVAEKLPLVAITVSNRIYEQPLMAIYLRNGNDKKHRPFAVGEFYCTSLVHTFIVPFGDQDCSNFLDEKACKAFWNWLCAWHVISLGGLSPLRAH